MRQMCKYERSSFPTFAIYLYIFLKRVNASRMMTLKCLNKAAMFRI